MTLIEVLTSLAILGTVLVGLIMAKARHTRQSAQASQYIEACAIADQLLESWWASNEGIPLESSGPIEGKPEWSWLTQSLDAPQLFSEAPTSFRPSVNEEAMSLPMEVVRLEVLGAEQELLASVELLVRLNREPESSDVFKAKRP